MLKKNKPWADFGNRNLRYGDVEKEPNEGIKMCGLFIPFVKSNSSNFTAKLKAILMLALPHAFSKHQP